VAKRPLRTRLAAIALLGAIAAIAAMATKGPPMALAVPPGAFAFAVLGDAPYYAWEELRYRVTRQDMDAHDLRLVLHVGDIFWRPCSDARYRQTLDEFNALRHPVVYTPGDNEWTDCWKRQEGGYVPLDRLARLRELFFSEPARSLGGQRIDLEPQSAREGFAEFVENARWSVDDVTFATLHMPGSANAGEAFAGRGAADDEAAARRTTAAVAWLRETFAAARAANARAVVIAFHANPGFESPVDDDYRQHYDAYILAIVEEVEAFARPVLMVQGDDHDFVVDRPLVRRTSGRRLENVTRMQVPGSPRVGWVRVVVTRSANAPWAFAERVVPGWKYW
jgi:hypothetical protein